MRTLHAFLIAIVAVWALLAVTPPAAAAKTPVEIIEAIYAAYGPDSFPENPEARYFTPDLLSLYDEVAEGSGDNPELGIDFDVFLNAQDIDEVTDLSTRIDQDAADLQVVDVTFTAFGQETIMRYTFVPTPDGRKIDDIDWGEEGANLRALLDQLKQDQANAG